MKIKVIRFVSMLLLIATLAVFTGCTDEPDAATSSNPYASFTPTDSGEVSVTSNAADGLKEPEKYPDGYEC